jgi:hypothetical protein
MGDYMKELIEFGFNKYEYYPIGESEVQNVVEELKIELEKSVSKQRQEALRDQRVQPRSIIEGLSHRVIMIYYGHKLTLASAIAVAKALADKNKYALRKHKCPTYQKKAAVKLLNEMGMKECTDLNVYINCLTEYQFIVLTPERGCKFLFCTPYNAKKKNIILLYHPEFKHYDVIKSIPHYFGYSYYCFKHDVLFNDKNKHRCGRLCSMCGIGKDMCSKNKDCGSLYCGYCKTFCDNHSVSLPCNHLKKSDYFLHRSDKLKKILND